jgi:hypothetical protein
VQLHNEDQTAKILNCTKAALRRWRRERRGPRFVKLGRLIRYRETDLEAFVDQVTENVIQGKRRLNAISS